MLLPVLQHIEKRGSCFAWCPERARVVAVTPDGSFSSEGAVHCQRNANGKPADPRDEGPDPVDVYGVNIVLENEDDRACPIIVENSPTMLNLLGTVDRLVLRERDSSQL